MPPLALHRLPTRHREPLRGPARANVRPAFLELVAQNLAGAGEIEADGTVARPVPRRRSDSDSAGCCRGPAISRNIARPVAARIGQLLGPAVEGQPANCSQSLN